MCLFDVQLIRAHAVSAHLKLCYVVHIFDARTLTAILLEL